jgi:hypothetical protein
VHHPDRVLRLEQRVEQMVVLHAGQRIERIELVRDQRCDDRLRGGHGRHAQSLINVAPTEHIGAGLSRTPGWLPGGCSRSNCQSCTASVCA